MAINKLLNNIVLLVSGTALSQAIMLMATPALSRMYTPFEFGQFALGLSILAILSPFSTWRYETAILIKEKSHPKSSLLFLSIILIIFSSLLLYLFGHSLGSFLKIELIEKKTLLFTGMFFFSTASETLIIWHIGQKRFGVVTIGKLIQATATVLFQIFFASEHDSWGLVYGFSIGLSLSFTYYTWELLRRDAGSINYQNSLSHISRAAIKHRNFPLYSVWATVLNSIVNQLPIILYGRFFSIGITGNFEMARRLTRAPLNLVGQSIFRVMSQHIGEMANNKKEAGKELETLISKIANYAIVPFLIIVFFLDDSFKIILGNQWARAGIYAQIISPWLFILFLSWPLTSAYNTFGHQFALIIFNLVFIICSLTAFGAYFLFDLDDFQVLIIMSLLTSLARLLYCYWILKKCGSQNIHKVLSSILLYLLLISSTVYFKY